MIGALIVISLMSLSFGDNIFDYKLYQDVLDPELCDRQLEAMGKFEFYDASFRVPQGLLEGNLASLGNYHQCLAIRQDFPGSDIEGKYCMIQASISPPVIRIPTLGGASSAENVTWTEIVLNLKSDNRKADGLYTEIEAAGIGATFRTDELDSAGQSRALSLGVCIPKTCTVDAVLAPFTENPLIGFNYTEQYCRLPGDKPFVAADYTIIIIFGLIGILTIISTTYELRHIFFLRREPKEANELFSACSVYSNTKKLLSFADNPRSLDCIDGIRSLSILWIILGHVFSVYLSNYVINNLELFQWLFQRRGLWITSSNFAVDTFFALSGLLLVYTSAKKMTQMTLLKNLHKFYLNRLLRIFPLLAAAVLIQASVMHRVSDGPGWHYAADQVNLCRRYWWIAFLHVQNIVNPILGERECLLHSWYLSVDIQLHILSPLVLFWLLGSRRAAWTSLAISILASLGATLAFCFIYNFPPAPTTPNATEADLWEYDTFYYNNTVTRSPPFFIGMMCGYILHIFRGQKVKLSKLTIALCYIMAVLLAFYALYMEYPNLQPDWDNQAGTNLNNTFRRACWAVAVSWMIIACVHGYGGPMNWFLSLTLWKFVARISYAMYLFHYIVQVVNQSAAVAPFYFNFHTVSTLFGNDLVYTVILSVAACVLIDAPMATLQKMLLGGNSKSQKPIEELEIRIGPDAEEEKVEKS